MLITIGCKDLTVDKEPNQLPDNGQYIQDTLYAISDSVIARSEVNTGGSTKLSLGQKDGFKAGFLIYFVFVDTLSLLDSMYLEFTTVNSYGADLVDNISVNIYSADSLWGPDANQYDRYRNPPIDKMEFVTRGSFKTADSAVSTFSIPLDFNNKWNIDEDQTTDSLIYNLYFELGEGNENAIVELGSALSSVNPVLVYYKNGVDSTSMRVKNANLSVSIFNYDEQNGTALNYPDGTLMVSSGIINHSLIKFDFSELPQDAIYYRALLELTNDDMDNYENSGNNSAFTFRALQNLQDSTYSTSNSFAMSSDGGFTKTTEFYGSQFAKNILQNVSNKLLDNEWLEVKFLTEYEDFSVKRFMSVENPDKSVRPRLIINYLNVNKDIH